MAPPQALSEKITKMKILKKNPCEKKKGRGAKLLAEKKGQGGKNLVAEISVLSAFRG